MRCAIFALCATLACVFMNYDIKAERDKERARIEALMRSSDYQKEEWAAEEWKEAMEQKQHDA